MKRAATLLVWLALLFGLPQVLICGVMIFSAGWLVAPLVLILLLVPIIPLILMLDISRWQKLPPAATASVAIPGKEAAEIRRTWSGCCSAGRSASGASAAAAGAVSGRSSWW